MKITILWAGASGYMASCFKALLSVPAVELQLVYFLANQEAPFEDSLCSFVSNKRTYDSFDSNNDLYSFVAKFEPDLILVSSWHIQKYRFVLRAMKSQVVRILAMDNIWRGTIKQRIGRLVSKYYIAPLYDGVFLPGKRQIPFAKMLGFKNSNIFEGLYSCNVDAFATENCQNRVDTFPPYFIFVGRFVEVKGLSALIKAYTSYRVRVNEPWGLICCGSGPLKPMLLEVPGVLVLDFVQPENLVEVLKRASCLILPSLYEPWGVVVHEAVASGLGVIASDEVGASDVFVENNVNGYIYELGDTSFLADLLEKYSTLPISEKKKMRLVSLSKSRKITPTLWAKNLITMYKSIRGV